MNGHRLKADLSIIPSIRLYRYQEDRRDDATGELMLGSVRLNRLSTPNINQRLSSTLLGIACLMVYSSCLRHPLSSNLVP